VLVLFSLIEKEFVFTSYESEVALVESISLRRYGHVDLTSKVLLSREEKLSSENNKL
jgi:hypothetical protein